jgi:hypothetical protein
MRVQVKLRRDLAGERLTRNEFELQTAIAGRLEVDHVHE